MRHIEVDFLRLREIVKVSVRRSVQKTEDSSDAYSQDVSPFLKIDMDV